MLGGLGVVVGVGELLGDGEEGGQLEHDRQYHRVGQEFPRQGRA